MVPPSQCLNARFQNFCNQYVLPRELLMLGPKCRPLQSSAPAFAPPVVPPPPRTTNTTDVGRHYDAMQKEKNHNENWACCVSECCLFAAFCVFPCWHTVVVLVIFFIFGIMQLLNWLLVVIYSIPWMVATCTDAVYWKKCSFMGHPA